MTNSLAQIKKLLMVDDAQVIQTITKIALEDRPQWQVFLASSGQEALDIACKERPDVILLDVMMPDMDGKETLQRLKQNGETAQIPVIFITAKVLHDEIEDYLGLGVLGVIFKPFDPMTLSWEIEKLIDGR